MTKAMNNGGGVLEKFEEGLEKWTIEHKISDIFHIISVDDIRKSTPEDCLLYAELLARKSFYIQELFNKEMAKSNWIDARIRDLTAQEVVNQKGYSYYERRMLAIKQNKEAYELLKQKNIVQAKIDRLSFLTTRIDKYVDVLSKMGSMRRQNYV